MRKTIGLILVIVAILAPLWVTPNLVVAQPPEPSTRSPGQSVRAASDRATDKIDPSLRLQAAEGGDGLVEVIVFLAQPTSQAEDTGSAITRLMQAGAVTRTILGQMQIVGLVRAGDLVKLASYRDVAAVAGVHRFDPPNPVIDPDVPQKRAIAADMIRQRVEAVQAAGEASDRNMLAARAGRDSGPSTPDPLSATTVTGWWDVLRDHKSSAAWAKGYTGAGVMVAALDSGVDFAHPDLQGTWAVQPHGPFAGWPIAFDSYSLALYANHGAEYGPDVLGLTWYADTRTICTTSPCRFQPFDARQAHDYVLPNTSQSGVYHIGTHPDTALATWWYPERVAVLVVDENAAGVYDTVYVDLDDDYDFTDEKPATKEDPISWKDNWHSAQGRPGPDGYPDISGGLVYYISDGTNYVPGLDWTWLPFVPNPPPLPGPGDMVAFMICDGRKSAGNHGQLVASAIAAQGVIDGGVPPWKPPASAVGGIDQGGGREARIIAVGNIYRGAYFDIYDFAALGYDGLPGTGDEPQIVNMSFGKTSTDNDGWDFESRYQTWLSKLYAPTLSWVASTGNGAPGYGTISPPTAPSGIGVGASTQYDSTGRFDSIQSVDQINWGDVMSWSNRGPGARGNNGVTVLANGAWGAGALTLNEWGDGWTAWDTWGGTSRSAPVAAGNLALIYQAYKERTGEFPTYDVARSLLMSSATDLGYNPLAQGAGSLNADRATDVAAGIYGVWASPSEWQVGDYRGQDYEGFANIIHAGAADTQTFTLHNHSAADIIVSLSDAYLVQMGEPVSYTIYTKNQSREDGAFTKPDYIIEVTDQIPPDADFVEVKATILYDEFTASSPTSRQLDFDTQWRVIVYDWTDVNGDGDLWTDLNGDGVVNSGEIDRGEYIRFNYGYNRGTTMQATVQHPARRSHDGVFVGLRHRDRTPRVPSTHVRLRLTFYQRVDWPWLTTPGQLTVPAGGSAAFEATLNVPADTPPGFHEGLILVEDPGDGQHEAHVSAIPVSVNAAASGTDFSIGGVGQDTPYDNGRIFGFFDWDWRAESGDWRFFFADVPDDHGLPPGTRWLVHTWWDTYPTDVDTIVMGPTGDDYSDPQGSRAMPDVFGPYTLDNVGRSEYTYQESGRWAFQTSSSSVDEWITAPLAPGLHLFALHNVLFSGKVMEESISGQIGTVTAIPDQLVVRDADTSGTESLRITTSMDLPDATAVAFGLSRPQVFQDLPVKADNPASPSTSSYTYQISVRHGGLLEARTSNPSGQSDIDLYVLHDADGDGTFSFDSEIFGSSAGATGDEWVQIRFPQDGDWLVAVHGWDAAPGDTFDATIRVIQGRDLLVTGTPTGPITGGSTVTLSVRWRGLGTGTWEGIITLGPKDGPGALVVPVILERLGQEMIIAALPTDTGHVQSTRPLTNAFGGGPMMTGSGTDRQVYNGAVQFDLSSLPAGAEIIAAQVELTGLDDRFVNPYAAGRWRLQLLESSIDRGWQNHGYWRIGRTPVEESIGPLVGDTDLAAGAVNTFVFAPSQLASLSDRLGTTGKASFRLDAQVIPSGSRHLFSWDGGRAGAPPVLRIVYLRN